MFPHRFVFYVAYTVGIPLFILAALVVGHMIVKPEMVSSEKISNWIMAEWFVITVAVFWFKQKMFPKLVFDFGKSARVDRNARMWRNVVAVGVVISLIVAVVGGLIVEKVLK